MLGTQIAELPDPFLLSDGTRVRTVDDWRRRREEIRELIVDVEYGGLPPTPSGVTAQPLHTHRKTPFGEASYTQYRVVHDDEPAFHFRLDVLVPASDGPLPVVLTDDGCWRYVTDEITRGIVGRGFILAQFSRTAIVPDIYTDDRTTGL
ncbi:MAG: hypothetical protein ACOC8F_00295 [Planctomycetota bacterium]